MPRLPITTADRALSPVSEGNSTEAALASGATFPGVWEDVGAFDSLVVAVKTDQNGELSVEFSPDGVNVDSALTRYYRTGQIEAPHRFTITRRFARVTFENTSASAQTFLRLQTLYGEKADLNAPLDSTLARDFDSISVRPTDYLTEVALGLRQGESVWNKFGYNDAVDTTAEIVASWGGSFFPMTTARTLSLASTDANDTNGGTGAEAVVIYGIDANRDTQIRQYDLSGLTPVVTAEQWLGINRIAVARAGSGRENAGTITATATTDLTIQGQIPPGDGTSQQCIFHVQDKHAALAEWIRINVIRFGSGNEPVVTVRGIVFSPVSNCVYEVFRESLDASLSVVAELKPPIPFPFGPGEVFWLEATSSRAGTTVNARFSLVEHTNSDAV